MGSLNREAPVGPEPSSLTGAQIICRVLEEEGVRHVFGYPGGAIMPFYHALPEFPTLRHVLTRHEQAAAHAADGYARASGGVGVCVATSGPGATNLVTGLATAMMDSSPVVAITGQVPRAMLGRDAFQETDVIGITLPITKHSVQVSDVAELAGRLHEAFAIAREGRPGPVVVDIPKDVQNQRAEYRPPPAHDAVRQLRRRPLPPRDEAIAATARLVAAAERPLLIVGHGVILGGAYAEVRALAEKTGMPVVTTLLGISAFPERHPLHLGMPGMHGEVHVNRAIQHADLILAIGMRFDDRVTGSLATYAQHAKKIHIDIDPSELNKNVVADAAILGDLRDTLRDMLDIIEPIEHGAWRTYISSMKGNSAVRDIQTLPDNGHLYAAHVINDIWRATEGKAIVVTDVGQHQMWEAQYYRHETPRSLITSGGLGTMGFALPAAIGAKMARPDAEVWVIVGDGGFQMTQAELCTAAQEGIKINIAIINNGFLGMVRQWQEFFYERRYAATPLRSPDFVKLADAHGLLGLRAATRPDVQSVIQQARSAPGTVVIDFRVEQEDSVYPMVPAGAALDAMIRRPPSPLVETAEDPN